MPCRVQSPKMKMLIWFSSSFAFVLYLLPETTLTQIKTLRNVEQWPNGSLTLSQNFKKFVSI